MEAVKYTLEDKLLTMFHEEWYEAMRDYLHSQPFLQIGAKVAALRKQTIVYPPQEKVFRIFKELPLGQVKVIWLGLDPYPVEGQACGHAFCNCDSHIVSSSLKIIHKEIENEYPEKTDRFLMPFGGIDKWDLSYLVKQGVFLLNSALTVEKSKPESHLELWKPFTLRVIEELNKQPGLVWLLMGKKAQGFTEHINPKHTIIPCVHPAAETYREEAGFLNSGVFRQINSYLDQNFKKEIEW